MPCHPLHQTLDLLGFLTLGLLGGFGHCVGMCSPFVLFVSRRYAGSGGGRGAAFAGQGWYTAGRVVTYSALGAIAGTVGSAIATAGALVGLRQAALVVAGVVLIAWALVALSPLAGGTGMKRLAEVGGRLAGLLPGLPAVARHRLLSTALPGLPAVARHRLLSSALPGLPAVARQRLLSSALTGLPAVARQRLLSSAKAGHPFALGLFLGLLPCGFLYAAVAAAVGRGGPVEGAAALALFGLGTAPALLGVSLADELLARRRVLLNRLAQVFILVMGARFLWRAFS